MDKNLPFGYFVYGSFDDKTDEPQPATEEVHAQIPDEEEDVDLPDLEEELEIALETAHQEEVAKHRIIRGATAGAAILAVMGLAAGLRLRSYFKKK